jgi:uncharacterized membrane protein
MSTLVLILIGAMAGVLLFLFGYMFSERRIKRINQETDDRDDAQSNGEEVAEQEWTVKEQSKIDDGVKSRMRGVFKLFK